MRINRKPAATTLEAELAETQLRLAEAEETLAAIRGGEVDALVVAGPAGDHVFSLEGAETPYRSLIEAMNDGALLLARDGSVLYANARLAELVKSPLMQVIGSPWQQFFLPSEHPKLEASLDKARHQGVRAEFQLQAADGSAQPVELSLSMLVRQGVEAFAAIVTSLRERKQSEAALQEANQSLQAQTAKLSEMVGELQHVSYAIVHDMRAPLRAMQGFAGFLVDEASNHRLSAEAQDYCRRIMVATARLDTLIRDALSYTKAILEEVPLQAVDLSALVRSLIETYPDLSIHAANIHVQGALPVVLGSEALLTQCFSNLLGNAVKFVAPGTKPSVRVYAQPSPGMARIWVEDNGIGIPAHARSRLFGMFQRLTNDYEGTGIGLAIVRKVVERMGGQVGVESDNGKGSRFWVDLHSVQNTPLAGRRSAHRQAPSTLPPSKPN